MCDNSFAQACRLSIELVGALVGRRRRGQNRADSLLTGERPEFRLERDLALDEDLVAEDDARADDDLTCPVAGTCFDGGVTTLAVHGDRQAALVILGRTGLTTVTLQDGDVVGWIEADDFHAFDAGRADPS